MKPIVDVALAPRPAACVTPLELLEDFADSAPSWCFQEDDSQHYAAVRGVPGCILRTRRRGLTVDLVFAALDANGALRLRLIDSDDGRTPLDPEMRVQVAAHFVEAFQRYLGGRSHLVEFRAVEADTEVYAT